MIRKLLLAAAATALMASQAMFPTKALADTTLKLVEVITSPERTETLKSDRQDLRGRQSRHQGRDHLAALGPGLREVRHHGLGRRHARRRRDAGPLAVALCQQRHAGEPRALSRQVGPHQGPQRPRAGDGPLRQEDSLHAALRLLSARAVLQQEAVQAGRHRRAADDARRLPRRRQEGLGATRQVRLLPARRPRRPQRLDDVRRHRQRVDNAFFKRGRHLDPDRPGLGQGPHVPGRSLQERLRAEGQRELGLQRDRHRLLFRHLRHARPGSRRADRRRRAHEQGRLRRRADAQGRRRQGLPDARLCVLVDVLRRPSTRTSPGS